MGPQHMILDKLPPQTHVFIRLLFTYMIIVARVFNIISFHCFYVFLIQNIYFISFKKKLFIHVSSEWFLLPYLINTLIPLPPAYKKAITNINCMMHS